MISERVAIFQKSNNNFLIQINKKLNSISKKIYPNLIQVDNYSKSFSLNFFGFSLIERND